MTIQTQAWESMLLAFAYEALHPVSSTEKLLFDDRVLNRAYEYCESITATHSRSFHLASSLLPYDKRRAVRALYSFCRISDDIVDGAIAKEYVENAFEWDSVTMATLGNEASAKQGAHRSTACELESWRQRILSSAPDEHDLVAVAWADARTRYHVPLRYAIQLIDGVERDLHQVQYDNFDDLAAYCYGVASTVGLMSMHIIGYGGDDAIPYAIKLGVALQLTNILRDVAEDYQAGRVYLPQEELDEFSLSNESISNAVESGHVDERWRRFMRFQIARNRQLYQEALPGIKLLNADGRFAICAAAALYRGILNDIERHDYNVFTRRAHVSTARKLSMLPSIWLQSR